MNTLTIRERAEKVYGDGEHRHWAETLIECADCIEKLRARCRQQRREIRRLNAAFAARRFDGAITRDLHRMQRNIERIARFVGCAK